LKTAPTKKMVAPSAQNQEPAARQFLQF